MKGAITREDQDKEAQNVIDGVPFLLDPEKRELVSKSVRHKWHIQDQTARQRQAELQVNWRRYDGDSFVQLHPDDPNRVWAPNIDRSRTPPSINKLKRTVHRYMAQTTADQPVVEGDPASHSETHREAAEASSHVLAGEWERMSLNLEFQRAVQMAAVLRSSFWFFEWDSFGVGPSPKQKFLRDPKTGREYLAYVDGEGNEVESADLAAKVVKGNIKVDVLTPFNVRWSGSRYAHKAREVHVAKVITLRELFDMYPEAKKLPVQELTKGVPPEAELWLEHMRGELPDSSAKKVRDENVEESFTGEDAEMAGMNGVLDRKVFLLTYMRRPDRTYRQGAYVITAGEHVMFQSRLPYKVIPVAHFKFLDELVDPHGISLIDLLRDPQELLDFVNGQILRYLQSMKRRWFVPMNSNVRSRDLLSPTQSIIEFNPKAGVPIPEQHPQMPRDFVDWADRFDEQFDDISSIHDTTQGKHVSGVSSGRHAEALRAGDETLLGLSREQFKEGLEAAGRVILEMVKTKWSTERRVRYWGAERSYVDLSFSGSDLGDTSDVRLKRGTMLMLTPAQKLETLFGYAEMGAIDPRELRELAPFEDVAGLKFGEDEHYKRASRENAHFLKGPPPELQQAYEAMQKRLQAIEQQVDGLNQAAGVLPPEVATPRLMEAQAQAQQTMQEWETLLARYMPMPRPFEINPSIAAVHVDLKARALAHEKVDRMPDYWVQAYEQRWSVHFQNMMAMQQQQAGAPGVQSDDLGNAQQPQPQAIADQGVAP